MSTDAYVRKLLNRAEGIWHGMGLVLESKNITHDGNGTDVSFRFHDMTPSQAELLVLYMSQAFRRAHVSWASTDGVAIVHVAVPAL